MNPAARKPIDTSITPDNRKPTRKPTFPKNNQKNKTSVVIDSIAQNARLYLRLSLIIGLTWTTGFIAIIVEVEFAWIIFIVLNCLQGLFIFTSFGYRRSKLDNIRLIGQYLCLKAFS